VCVTCLLSCFLWLRCSAWFLARRRLERAECTQRRIHPRGHVSLFQPHHGSLPAGEPHHLELARQPCTIRSVGTELDPLLLMRVCRSSFARLLCVAVCLSISLGLSPTLQLSLSLLCSCTRALSRIVLLCLSTHIAHSLTHLSSFTHIAPTPSHSLTSSLSLSLSCCSLWFDIEGTWPTDTTSNAQFLQRAQQALSDNGVPGGIYCGREWPQYFGSYTGAKELPLWYAHYDSIPSFRDWYGTPYGGWSAPNIKQYDADGSSTRHCGIEIDSDWTPSYPA
jgi:hypothetical protein